MRCWKTGEIIVGTAITTVVGLGALVVGSAFYLGCRYFGPSLVARPGNDRGPGGGDEPHDGGDNGGNGPSQRGRSSSPPPYSRFAIMEPLGGASEGTGPGMMRGGSVDALTCARFQQAAVYDELRLSRVDPGQTGSNDGASSDRPDGGIVRPNSQGGAQGEHQYDESTGAPPPQYEDVSGTGTTSASVSAYAVVTVVTQGGSSSSAQPQPYTEPISTQAATSSASIYNAIELPSDDQQASQPEVSTGEQYQPTFDDPGYALPVDAINRQSKAKPRLKPKLQEPVTQPAEGGYSVVADQLLVHLHQEPEEGTDTLHGASLVPEPVYMNPNPGEIIYP